MRSDVCPMQNAAETERATERRLRSPPFCVGTTATRLELTAASGLQLIECDWQTAAAAAAAVNRLGMRTFLCLPHNRCTIVELSPEHVVSGCGIHYRREHFGNVPRFIGLVGGAGGITDL